MTVKNDSRVEEWIETNNIDTTTNLTTTGTVQAGHLKDTSLTNTRLVIAGSGGQLSDDSDLTFSGSRLTATDLTVTNAPIVSSLTAGRVVLAGASKELVDDADLSFSGDTLSATNVTSTGTIAGPKVKLTPDGGIAVKLTNKTGGNSVKGEVVTLSSGTNNAVSKIVVDVPDPIGVFLDSGVADGQEAWVVVSGIADVYFIGNTTRGHIARGFLTADGAGYVTGQAMSEAVPSSPFSADKHFYEIGHVLETRTGAGLAKCVLHFN